jgi:hypothetical protein
MKTKYIEIFSVVLLALSASCTDLDVNIKSMYTEFPDNGRAAEAVAANAYYAMRGPLGRYYNCAQTLSSDEAMAKSYGGNWYDSGAYSQLSLHWWNADNGFMNYWDPVSTGITNCNTLINQMGDNELEIARIRAVRAYYHWVLMDSYGDVPIVDRLLEETEALPRSSRADVARFIESELLAVIDKLPTDVNAITYGKPTRWMAAALLVKLYINWAVYTCGDVATYTPAMANAKLNDAVKMCDDIIASGKFDLSDSFRSKFLPENGSHIKDFIYAMPFDRVTQRGMTYARFWTHYGGNMGFYGLTLPSNAVGGGGIFAMTPEFIDKFNLEGDDRNAQFIGGPLFVRNPSTYEATTTPWELDGQQVVLSKVVQLTKMDRTLDVSSTLLGGHSEGYRSIKFYLDLKTTSTDGRSQNNDVPIFRFADVLLMKTEAILRGATATNGDTPMSLMNQIRTYVHAPLLTRNPTLDELLDERAREFADENWRRNDLIRFGRFEDDWGYKHLIVPEAKTQLYRRIFAMPTSILNKNTNWSQNPGY